MEHDTSIQNMGMENDFIDINNVESDMKHKIRDGIVKYEHTGTTKD